MKQLIQKNKFKKNNLLKMFCCYHFILNSSSVLMLKYISTCKQEAYTSINKPERQFYTVLYYWLLFYRKT